MARVKNDFFVKGDRVFCDMNNRYGTVIRADADNIPKIEARDPSYENEYFYACNTNLILCDENWNHIERGCGERTGDMCWDEEREG